MLRYYEITVSFRHVSLPVFGHSYPVSSFPTITERSLKILFFSEAIYYEVIHKQRDQRLVSTIVNKRGFYPVMLPIPALRTSRKSTRSSAGRKVISVTVDGEFQANFKLSIFTSLVFVTASLLTKLYRACER